MSKKQRGKVFIASMNMRGKWADVPEGVIKINVTSAQAKNSKNRLDFSPMTHITGGYKGYWNFEAYWQSGKIFEGISKKVSRKWWKELKAPKRRYPNSKGKKVLYSKFHGVNQKMSYIQARKKVYVKEYYDLIKKRKMTKYWKKQVKDGQDVVVFDFDGPRGKDGELECLEVTKKLLKKKIKDVSKPFGHGYVVAGILAGIKPKKYAKDKKKDGDKKWINS